MLANKMLALYLVKTVSSKMMQTSRNEVEVIVKYDPKKTPIVKNSALVQTTAPEENLITTSSQVSRHNLREGILNAGPKRPEKWKS